MICGIIGGLGSGKTLLQTFMLKTLQDKYGYHIFANYKLNKLKYTHFSTIEDFNKLDKRYGNVIGIDEIHVSADARHSMSPLIIQLSQKVLQSRKMSSLQKPTHMFFTAQLITSVEYRIRSSDICNSLWKPKILVKDEITNRPLLMSVDVYVPDKERVDEFIFKRRFHLKGMDLYNICDYYDTSEIVESIVDNTLRRYVDKYMEIGETVKKQIELEAYLKAKEPNLSKSFIKDVAALIRLMRREEDIDIGSS